MLNTLTRYAAITKIDEEQRMVWGYASTEEVDSQGETVTKAAMQAAWDDYMQFANIREMHGPSAAGVVKESTFDDVGVFIGAKIVDDAAWEKVKEGVYKGFSIGGSKTDFDPITKTINGLKLTEISLVDRPANPAALITMYKADGVELMAQEENPLDKLTALLAKGDISIDRLLDMAEQDVLAKAAKADDADSDKDKEPDTNKEGEGDDDDGETGDDKKQDDKKDAKKADHCVELKKSFQALAIKADDIKKGMYSVGWLADLIDSLQWLQNDTAWEAEYEGDNSPLPGKLAAAIQQLGTVLVEMAQEEVSELVAGMGIDVDADPITLLSDAITNSAAAADLQKFAPLMDIAKSGARNSAADADRLQKAHDLLSELGACCDKCDTEKSDTAADIHKCDHNHVADELQKSALAGESNRIAKMASDLEKMASELGSLRKSHDLLQSDNAEIKKAFAATPTLPKGILLSVAKGDDVTTELAPKEVEPIRKSDGTVDELATAILKAHQEGPTLHIR